MRFVIKWSYNFDGYGWTLVKKDGTEIAISPDHYRTVNDARSNIASARTAMRGARFAKVVVDNERNGRS